MLSRLALILVAGLVTAAPAAADVRMQASSTGARAEAREALSEAKALLDGRGVESGKEVTPALKELAVRMRALPEPERREAGRILARPSRGEVQPGDEPYRATSTEHRHCTAHFCVHWVTPGPGLTDPDTPPLADGDADGVPDYVETMSQTFETAFGVENVEMGWREPTPDGERGGDFNKTDVYLKQLGPDEIFGYAAPDAGQVTNSQTAYLVMDNDFSPDEYKRYSDPLPPLQVTAAHEYNHVIQFGYDVYQDTWMFEGTATWIEDKVFDDINDYVHYVRAWARLSPLPLTYFNGTDPSDPFNAKAYGDAVWNRWIDERYGQDVVRTAWEKSLDTQPASFAPDAYDAALLTKGTTFFDAFTRFAADTAEWQTSTGPFEEGPSWPEVERVPVPDTDPPRPFRLQPGGPGVLGAIDHLSYWLLDVVPTDDERIKLVAELPRGTRSAFALVGREGPPDTGTPVVEMVRLPRGGRATVELANPGRFQRITAVVVNSDYTQSGYSQFTGEWRFARDNQALLVRASNDYTPPRVRRRSPAPGARAARRAPVVVTFSETMEKVSAKTMHLVGPGGKRVSARVSYDARRRQARLVPKRPLAARKRYVVKIGSTVVDRGDNELAAADRTWKFSTRSR